MSTDTSAEVNEEDVIDKEDPTTIRIRAEVKLSTAVRDYLEASEKFEAANKKYGDSCQALRVIVKQNTSIVVRQTCGNTYGKHYLLTSDSEGNFGVNQIDVI